MNNPVWLERIAMLLALTALLLLSWLYVTVPRLADCEEDQVLIGAGDFDGHHWDRYLCGPALDDFQP